jgi:signal peptidase
MKNDPKTAVSNLPPQEQEKNSVAHRVMTVIGIILCVILTPMLIINCTLIIKSFVNKSEVPTFGGYMPLIVLTDSMYPDIAAGDLIFCRTVDPDSLTEGDVISFFDPAGNGTVVTTHKIVEILTEEDGSRSFRTRGINNNTDDRIPVHEDKVVGIYTDFRLEGAGNVALFMQSSTGLIVCVVVPLIALIGYDLIRRRLYDKSKGNDVAALMAELEALKAEKAAAQEAAATPTAAPEQDDPKDESPSDT